MPLSLLHSINRSSVSLADSRKTDTHHTRAPTRLYVCHFNAESRSHVLKFQQRPSEFGRKVWETSQTEGLVSPCSGVKQIQDSPSGAGTSKDSGRGSQKDPDRNRGCKSVQKRRLVQFYYFIRHSRRNLTTSNRTIQENQP